MNRYVTGATFRCRNCFEHREDHTDGTLACLFAPAVFQSMDPAAYEAWYVALPPASWGSRTGADLVWRDIAGGGLIVSSKDSTP